MTVAELRELLGGLDGALPVVALFDAGCAEGDVVGVEVTDRVRLVVD